MSAGLAVEALSLRLGAFHLRSLDLAVSSSEILAILGPNGAGKSVTLETIAGFHRPDSGRVLIGGRDVTALAAERRNVGFVVQNFGLFPHLTVAQNVAIARRAKRQGTEPDRAISVPDDDAGLLAYVGVAHLAHRWPEDLSPGEKQRVALARALASAPDLFLFDEPFAALDAQTRDELRDELRSFLHAVSIPAIFVTHDHADAMMLADRIAVLREGVVVQHGLATEIFAKPANTFVARFVGTENILDARVVEAAGSLATLAVGGRNLHASVPAGSVPVGRSVCAAIRGEQVIICPPKAKQCVSSAINQLDGRITSVRYAGPLATVEIDCGFPLKGYLLAPQARAMNIDASWPVAVEIAADAIHIMPN
jgi:molybdate/tungstate transport system ATP-binding protein